MINIIITSYKEPKATLRAINAFLSQKIKEEFRIIVVDPFPEVKDSLDKNLRDKRVEFFLDPGEGKSYALNLLFETYYHINTDDLIIFTDGDVYVSSNSVNEIIKSFSDKTIGGVTGRPVCVDSPDTKYGFWAKTLYDAVHKIRKRLNEEGKFFQCSGYLFAIRNGIVSEIPLEVPEDAIIPYLIWKKGYKIAYSEKAEVYVKYPSNWKDWVNQRVRTIKAHENISKVAPDMPRTKSLFNEIKEGIFFMIKQPKNIKQFFWMIQLYFARLYIYFKSFIEIKMKKVFNPAWREEEVKSTKPLD